MTHAITKAARAILVAAQWVLALSAISGAVALFVLLQAAANR